MSFQALGVGIMKLRVFSTTLLSAGFLSASGLLVGSAAWPTTRADIKPVKPVSIRMVPEKVTVWGAQGTQHFMVLAKYADGLERDVTAASRFTVSQPAKGEIDGTGKLVARSAGEVVLTAKYEGRSAKSAVHLEGTDQARPFTFTRDIEGILTKHGCNDVLCHAGVKGRAGFKLSMYGIHPREDYKWIVEGGTFRVLTTEDNPKHPRINVKEPEKSLLLLKPTFSVPHGGGLRFKAGSEDYQTLVKWIKAGAPY